MIKCKAFTTIWHFGICSIKVYCPHLLILKINQSLHWIPTLNEFKSKSISEFHSGTFQTSDKPLCLCMAVCSSLDTNCLWRPLFRQANCTLHSVIQCSLASDVASKVFMDSHYTLVFIDLSFSKTLLIIHLKRFRNDSWCVLVHVILC